MHTEPQMLTSWKVIEGNGFIQADPSSGYHRCTGDVHVVQTTGHPPIDADLLGFGEVEVVCDVS